MIRVALRGMARRKLRTALTAIAIVLGVALITGTYVLTDSIKGAFGGIFTAVYQGTDATVTGKSAFDLSGRRQHDGAALRPVAAAEGPRAAGCRRRRRRRRRQRAPHRRTARSIAFGGAPNLGFSVDPTQPELNSLTLVDGHVAGAEPGRDRPGDRAQEGPEGRADDRRRRRAARPSG